MPDNRVNQIAQLRQSISSLEETQRQTGIDLSGSITIQQRLLAQLEQEPYQSVSAQSGGVHIDADRVTAEDIIGRDQVVSNTQTITATDSAVAADHSAAANDQSVANTGTIGGHVLINSTLIVYSGDDPAADQARLAKYLKHIAAICAPLKLAAIDQGAAKPGTKPLGLTNVYVDLNLDLKIPAVHSFADYLNRNRHKRAEVDMEARDIHSVSVLEALVTCHQLVLLGKPGSGKSTLSAYLALSLAEAGLGLSGAIERLGKDWTHGPLLPVRVILRQFAAGLPADLKRGRAHHLWTFISDEVQGFGIHAELGALLHKVADQTGALFLFDGLDEAGDEQRRARVLEAVTEFMSTAGDHCRFLITARPYAWEDAEQRIAQVEHVYRLADFELDQIDLFIVRWYEALLALGWVEDARTADSKTRELQTATRRTDLQALAANPLLLTLMATLHSNRTTRLPDDRVDVYDEVVKLLLERWHKPDDGERSPLETLSITLSQLRGRIEGLAFEAHAENVGHHGTADIGEAALSAAFRPLLGGSRDQAQQVIQYIEQRAGLLVGQGVRQHQRQFTFPHRAFQEYLAACHLAGQRDFEKRVHELVTTAPEHWREVVIYAARIAGTDRGVGVADALIHRQRCDDYRRSHTLTDNDWRAAVLAGLQLVEVGLQEVVTGDAYHPVCDRVSNWLLRLIETPRLLPLAERIEAGNLLGRLGDPRFKTIYTIQGKPHYILPPLAHISAGRFEMGANQGEKNSYNDEFSAATDYQRHSVEVAEFLISCYPVTNAEYYLYMIATSAPPPVHWRDGEIPIGLATHPVVNVSWHDAHAYCNWLSKVWGRSVRLPTEAEWEKAARWDEVNQHPRQYPWGDEWNEARCNSKESGLGMTTPVGIYPDGASALGVYDAAGNIREWTSSTQSAYPYHVETGQKMEVDLSSRVVRGGAWSYTQECARCAYRYRNDPTVRTAYIGFRYVLSLISCS